MVSADDLPPDDEPPQFVRYGTDVVGSAGAVVPVGLLLFTVSGVWPPLVAIESPSMEPQMERGDAVFVMAAERFAGPDTRDGVVTASAAGSSEYTSFGRPSDVIVYRPDGATGGRPSSTGQCSTSRQTKAGTAGPIYTI